MASEGGGVGVFPGGLFNEGFYMATATAVVKISLEPVRKYQKADTFSNRNGCRAGSLWRLGKLPTWSQKMFNLR